MLFGQKIESKYYKSLNGIKKVGKRKALYEKRIIKLENKSCIEYRKISNDSLIEYSCFQNWEPLGIWKMKDGRTLDFDFELNYDELNTIDLADSLEIAIADSLGIFSAPSFNKNGKEFYDYIKEEVVYPSVAIEQLITGVVYIAFIINKQGYVKDISVYGSVHPSLDKEAMRIIRESPQWTPAKIENNNINFIFMIPIRFSLN